jgi:O-antigen ligase
LKTASHPRSDSLFLFLLTALLLFGPLAFGSVEPWASAILTTGSALLVLLWALKDRLASFQGRKLSIALLLLALLPLFQLLPLGPLVKLLSPAAADLQSEAGLPVSSWKISVHPEATLLAAARLGAALLLFIALINTVRSRRDIRRLTLAMVIIGAGLGTLAIAQYLTADPGTLYWIRPIKSWSGHPPFGPYVNRNHFAGLMALLVPLGLGYLLSLGERRDERTSMRSDRRFRQWPAAIAVAIMTGALFMSSSRAGILSALAATALMAVVLSVRGVGGRKAWFSAAAVGIAGVAAAMLFGSGRTLTRFLELEKVFANLSENFRVVVWVDMLKLIRDFPLVGSGLGTFDSIFSAHYQSLLDITVQQGRHVRTHFAHAHNDHLQFLAETGLAGLLFAGSAVLLFLRQFRAMIRRRHDREVIILGIGGLAGMTAFLLHSVVEFNFHIPANAFYFTVVAALALSALRSRSSS